MKGNFFEFPCLELAQKHYAHLIYILIIEQPNLSQLPITFHDIGSNVNF